MIVKVRVKAGAKRERMERMGEGFSVSVREPAERNEANTRVRELLAHFHKIPLSRVRFISGQRSPSKKFQIIT